MIAMITGWGLIAFRDHGIGPLFMGLCENELRERIFASESVSARLLVSPQSETSHQEGRNRELTAHSPPAVPLRTEPLLVSSNMSTSPV